MIDCRNVNLMSKVENNILSKDISVMIKNIVLSYDNILDYQKIYDMLHFLNCNISGHKGFVNIKG